MDQDAATWSAEEIAAFIQQMSRASVEQYVRQHQYLQKFALAGFSKQLPKDYPQRIARVLAQRARTNQQDLKHLLERWRQDHPAICQALQPLEPSLSLEMLQPLIEQYGGQDVLSALRTDPRAERFSELCAVLKEGMARGEISRAPTRAAPPEAPARAGKVDEPTPLSSRPDAPHPKPPIINGTGAHPQTVAEYVTALESQVHTLTTLELAVVAYGAQLAQPAVAHNPQAVQRTAEKLSTASQKQSEGLRHFAALEGELLERLRAEVQQAEAAGLADGLTALLPGQAPLTTTDEARAHLQGIQQVRERLSAALARHEQRRAALAAAPAVIGRLLDEIEGLEGETGPLRANLASLKTTIAKRASDKETERALKSAEQILEKAIGLRDTNLENWISTLQRARHDAETLLHQSLHLSTDPPEVTNLQQALEEAQSLLAAPLPFKQPQPLPFSPVQMLSCYAALRQRNDHLRQALAAYNPQIALATLEDFDQMENPQPTPQQLREIGAALVGAASLPGGYGGLIWRVGSRLLMLLEDATAEQFYERYGVAAVARGLAASLRAGDFPLGLAFAEQLFYTGADISSVFAHPRVQETLSEVSAAAQLPRVASDCFAQASPAIRKAALALLSTAAEISLPKPLPLQLSGALLTASRAPEERAQAGLVFMQMLLEEEQPLNAYCVWRALAQEQPNLFRHPVGLQALYSLIWRLSLDTHAPVTQLVALCSESALHQEGFVVPGIALALCLGSLLAGRAQHPQAEELTQQYAAMLRDHHYPVLSDTLLAQLPSYHDAAAKDGTAPEARETAIETMRAEFSAALAEADRRIQVSNYRFAPTKQMRMQIDARLKAALAALQQPGTLHDDLLELLLEDDPDDVARTLIEQEEENRRQYSYDSIEGGDLKKLRKDLEHVAAHLSLAAQKRAQLLKLGADLRSTKRTSGGMHAPPDQEANEQEDAEWRPKDEALLGELHRMLSEVPQARPLLQQVLPAFALEMS